jgi:hypothetical protein
MVSSYQSASAKAKALKSEAALKASERAKETTALAAAQKVSFLNSGISLTGEDNTTPMSVLSDTYTKGKEDISQIKENYNAQLKNVWSQARSSFLSSLGGLALGVAGSGLFSGASSVTEGAEAGLESSFNLGSLTDYSTYQKAGLVL